MYENLNVFQTASALASHSARQQSTIAQNIANADTPGYQARTLASFEASYRDKSGLPLRETRAGHIAGSNAPAVARETLEATEPSPNGNSVSLEEEMVNAVAAQQRHDQALAVYKHGLSILRMSLGR